MSITPPMGDFPVSGLSCTYEVAPAVVCGKPATWHIVWTADLENGTACDEHMEAARGFAYYAAHPNEPVCHMPGAVFIEAENRCDVDEDALGLSVSETVSVDA